jgi:hypothetical protein
MVGTIAAQLSSGFAKNEFLTDSEELPNWQKGKSDMRRTSKFRIEQEFQRVLIFRLVVWNMNFMISHILGIIIPTDFHIFQRG